MGLLWAIGGFAIGGVIELLDNVLPGGLPMASAVDMWPQTLALIAFFGGGIFAIVLGIAGARRRFDQLSMPWFAAWGALAGLLLGLRAVSGGAPLLFVCVPVLGSAALAAGSLALARRAEHRELLAAGAVADEVGLSASEAKQLLGRTD